MTHILPARWREGALYADLRDFILHIDWPGCYRHGGDLFSMVTVREGARFRTEAHAVAECLAALSKAGVLQASAREEWWHWVARSRGVGDREVGKTPGLGFDALCRSWTLCDTEAAREFRATFGRLDDAWFDRMAERKSAWLEWRQCLTWKVGY